MDKVPDVRWIVDGLGSLKLIISPSTAVLIAFPRLPGPNSAVLVTNRVLADHGLPAPPAEAGSTEVSNALPQVSAANFVISNAWHDPSQC
jgi:hypothetical protein